MNYEQLISQLQNNWWSYTEQNIKQISVEAENNKNVDACKFLSYYFYFKGDYVTASYFAQVNNLYQNTIVTTLIDYYIWEKTNDNYGSLNNNITNTIVVDLEPGTTLKSQQSLKQQYSITYTQQLSERSQTIEQNYSILNKLKNEQIQQIIDSIVNNSSQEYQLQFKLQCKQINENMIQSYTQEQVDQLLQNLPICDDIKYKYYVLKQLFNKYLSQKAWKKACDIITTYQYIFSNNKVEDEQSESQILIGELLKEKDQELYLYQVCFIFQENLSNKELKDLIFYLEEQDESNIIENCFKILSGQISNQLKIEFIRLNEIVDKLAVKQLSGMFTQDEAVVSSFLSFSLHQLSSGLFNYNKGLVSGWKQWQVFQFYQQIGLIYRDKTQISDVYQEIFKTQINNNDGYTLGGALSGLAIQMINQDVSEILIQYLEIFEQISNFKEEDKIPVLYALGISTGLITLGNNDDSIKDIYYTAINQNNNVVSNFGLIIGLGLTCFGCQKEYNSERFQQLINTYGSSQRQKEQQAMCLASALVNFNSQNIDDQIIKMWQNNDLMPLIYGLAYYHSNNYQIEQKLLELAMQQNESQQGKYAILAFSLVVDQQQYNQMFDVLQQLSQSHSKYVRQAVCLVFGLFYSNTPNEQVVRQLIKMMQDQEEIVRAYAIVGLSFVLQNVSGCKIPEYQKVEYDQLIGDRVEKTIYKSDFQNEQEFQKAFNFNQIFKEDKDFKELYNLIYVNKLPRHLTIEEITTVFRYQLVQTHKNLFIQRCMCLALGIMNCGGFCMKFTLQKDIQIVGYILFLLSFNFYPLMAYLGLAMEPQYICAVSMENGEIKSQDIIMVIDKNTQNKYKVSELFRNKQLSQYENFLAKTKLSKQELNKSKNQQIEEKDQFSCLKYLKQKSIEKYVNKLQGMKNQETQEQSEDDDDIIQLQLPCRCLKGMEKEVQIVEGNEYVPLLDELIQGINVCKENFEQ